MSRWELARTKQVEYAARRPTQTDLYRLVFNYRDTFERSWETLFQHEYGALRQEVLDALDKYLDCGILLHGAARAVCPRCNHSILVAYSCKRRCLCPSCDAKRSLVFAENLVSNVLLPYPQRHLVFAIPKRLRCYFKFNRTLLSHIYAAAWGAWNQYVREAIISDVHTGMVAALHTAGDLLAWHPHAHTIALSGAVDEAGTFHELPAALNLERICELFREKVFRALVKEGFLDEETVASMKTWQHSGFSVFASDPIPFEDKERLLFLARYLKRCPVSCERMVIDETIPDEPKVLYSSYKDGVAVSTREFSPLQFLAEISQHVPDLWEQTSRFFGMYSARTRGAAKANNKEQIPDADSPRKDPAGKPSISWARCMKRIFNVDPLLCSRCGETMRIKAFIRDSKEIERLCKNLGLNPWRAPPAMAKISLAA